MLSFLKKLFGASEEQPEPEKIRPEAKADAAPGPPEPDLSKAGELLDCSGVSWNEEEQRRFVEDVIPRQADQRLTTLLLDESFKGNEACSPADAAVLFSIVCELEPTRLMEVGSGYSTRVLRHALKVKTLPGELIAIDEDPAADIGEYVDAQLFQPVQEVPLDDFKILQPGELVFFDTTHRDVPGGEVEHIFEEIFPTLPTGVLVGFHGIRLPRNYTEEELRAGYSEQERLLSFLSGNDRAEIIFAGGWVKENHPDKLRNALPEMARDSEITSFWFRMK